MAIVTQKIGPISAYAIAKEEGYTGTKEQFATEIGNASVNAQAAAASATEAEGYATSAATSASNAMSTTPAGYNSMMASIAPEYDPTDGVYAAGDYCRYNAEIYRCVTAINAPEAFDSTKWTKAVIGEELSQLSEDIMMLTSVDDIFVNLTNVQMTVGSYLKSDGSIGTNANFMVSDYIEYPRDAKSLTVNRTVYTPDGTTYQRSNMIWFYNSEKTLLGTGTDPYTSGNMLTVYPHASTKYIRVNFSVNKVMPFININKTPLVSINSMANRGYTDMNDVPVNVITGRYSPYDAIDNLPYTNWLGTVLCMSAYGYVSATKIQLSFSNTGRFHYRRSWGGSNNWGSWVEFESVAELNSILGYVGSYSGAFSEQEAIDTGIQMDANGTYIIKFYNTRTGAINVYGKGKTSSYKSIYVYEEQIAFTNDSTARNLMLYNPDSQSDSINIKVYKPDSMMLKSESVPRKYIVSKSATRGDYTSLSKCLFDLKDNTDPKTIEIWGGDYDIYAEYCELYDAGLLEIYSGDDPSMDYFPYCVWVPKNTHIVGKGLVRLKWEPDPAEDDITPNQCKTISPLNVAAGCTIENIEVYCKNGRYCLHNDGLGKQQFTGAVQRYINCRFYKYDNDVDSVSGSSYGFSQTTGFGIDRNMHHIYENCVFVNYASSSAFYGHSRSSVISNEAQSSDISLINCVIDTQDTSAVRFGNPTTNRNIHIRVMFNGCYISGIVLSRLETSASDSCANGFDVQYLNCGAVTMQINDPDNPYTPKAYNTTLTMAT